MATRKHTTECTYCGSRAPITGCKRCLRAGIDVPALRGKLRKLTTAESLVVREAAVDEMLDLAELQLLVTYLRGPRICSRYDALPPVVQCAANRAVRMMEEN